MEGMDDEVVASHRGAGMLRKMVQAVDPKRTPPTLTRLTVSDKIIIYKHAMRQTNATIKCNKPTGVYTTAF